MGTLLSPSQECHPFPPSFLAHDLVVSAREIIQKLKETINEDTTKMVRLRVKLISELVQKSCRERNVSSEMRHFHQEFSVAPNRFFERGD
jgi:uncharacterized protein YlaI